MTLEYAVINEKRYTRPQTQDAWAIYQEPAGKFTIIGVGDGVGNCSRAENASRDATEILLPAIGENLFAIVKENPARAMALLDDEFFMYSQVILPALHISHYLQAKGVTTIQELVRSANGEALPEAVDYYLNPVFEAREYYKRVSFIYSCPGTTFSCFFESRLADGRRFVATIRIGDSPNYFSLSDRSYTQDDRETLTIGNEMSHFILFHLAPITYEPAEFSLDSSLPLNYGTVVSRLVCPLEGKHFNGLNPYSLPGSAPFQPRDFKVNANIFPEYVTINGLLTTDDGLALDTLRAVIGMDPCHIGFLINHHPVTSHALTEKWKELVNPNDFVATVEGLNSERNFFFNLCRSQIELREQGEKLAYGGDDCLMVGFKC